MEKREHIALGLALGLHVCLILFLLWDPNGHERPVLVQETHNEPGDISAKSDIVKATAVDQKAVMEMVSQLKQAKQQEALKQQALLQQAKLAKEARLSEQKHLQALKAEAARIAIARQKALQEEKKHLKDIADKQKQAAQALEHLKKQQAEQLNAQKVAIAQQQAAARAAEQAAQDSEKRARLAGVVDKYKALILNAISRRWILPEDVKPGLSSEFSIRLAPDGDVLAVNLTRSSGNAVLDRSAQAAIYKASPLPVPPDPESFSLFREIHLTVRPES